VALKGGDSLDWDNALKRGDGSTELFDLIGNGNFVRELRDVFGGVGVRLDLERIGSIGISRASQWSELDNYFPPHRRVPLSIGTAVFSLSPL